MSDVPYSASDADFDPEATDGLADEELDFSRLMADVVPHEHDRADIKKPGIRASKASSLQYRRSAAVTETQQFDQGLSDQLKQQVDSEESLVFSRDGVALKALHKLRQGNPPWEEGVDLHGYTVDQAREETGRFIRQAARKGLRSVIVVHGKAHKPDGSPALIKSYVNDWLRQMPQVLAFISAQPKDGGTGALYVLLKRKQ